MILLKKAVRSIWRNKRAYLACVVLMAIGISVFVSFNLLYENLDAAKDALYKQSRFGDVFASVRGVPLGATQTFTRIPGVARAGAVNVADVRVLGLDTKKIVTLRLSSYDPDEPEPLNAFVLVAGSPPGQDELLVGEKFAVAHNLTVGDPISLLYGGRELTLTVSGLAQSPEYVYAIPDTGQIMPDDEAFGFGYMNGSRMGAFTGRTGLATNLSLLLEEGITFDDVKNQLEDTLQPYGLISLVARKDQTSNTMLHQEITQLGSMASSMPMIFIAMAVIILYIMLKRVIEQERGQIGTLKAFGFSDSAVVGHYLCYGGITGLIGGVLGVAAGLGMTSSLTELYLVYFSLPALSQPPGVLFPSIGMVIAVGSGLLGSIMGARSILKLSPSEAMRPAAPPPVGVDLVGRIPFFRRILNAYGYMAVRNITRNKFRSAFVVLGLAFSFALTAFLASYGDMIDVMLLQQFTKVELYDLKISLQVPGPYTQSIESAWALDGVSNVEGILEIPVQLRHHHLQKGTVLTAIPANSQLYHIYDSELDQVFAAPSGGAVISRQLARDLDVTRGDVLTIRTRYTGDRGIDLTVLDVISQNIGSAVYMELSAAWDLLDISPSVSGVLLSAEDIASMKETLVDGKNIAALTDQEEAKRIYADMLDTYGSLLYMLQLAGVGIAFAIITNTSSISLSERSREYATMRVLGMHPWEIGQVVSFEYWLLTAVAVPPGIVLTRLIKIGMNGMIDNELFSLPIDTPLISFVMAGAGCAAAVALSNWMARYKIAKFDMVEVLKERE